MEKITGPIEGHGHSGVTDVGSYKEVHARAMKSAGKDVFEVSSDVEAYINHGRWVVDCSCNGAGLTSPEFKVSCCFDCGRIYTAITFPKQRKKIEDTLVLRRDKAHRNWTVGESLSSLDLGKGVS
tara:strand:+ start:3286 stop:3660 length:375 start_codon:yes stop_codon:yes gene_type:complete